MRAHAIPRSAAPRAPAPAAAPADPHLHRRHSDTVLSQSLWSLWVLVGTRFLWAIWGSLRGMGFDSKRYFAPHHLAGASPLPLDVGCLFLVRSNIVLTVVQQWVVILAHPSSPSSWKPHQLYCNLKTVHVATSTIMKPKNCLCGKITWDNGCK